MKKNKVLTSLTATGVLSMVVPISATSCSTTGIDFDYQLSDVKWDKTPHAKTRSILTHFVITKNNKTINYKSIEVAEDCSKELRAYINNNICVINPTKEGKFKLVLLIRTGKDTIAASAEITVDHKWNDEYYFIKDGHIWAHKVCECGISKDVLERPFVSNDIEVNPKPGQTASEALNEAISDLRGEKQYNVYLPIDQTIYLNEVPNLEKARHVAFEGRRGSKIQGSGILTDFNSEMIFNCVTFTDHTELTSKFWIEKLIFSNCRITKNANISLPNKESHVDVIQVTNCTFDEMDRSQFARTTDLSKNPNYWTSLTLWSEVNLLIVDESTFNGSIYNAIQANPGIKDSIIITDNIFKNIENRALVFSSFTTTRYVIENNIFKNCNPYDSVPIKYSSNSYWKAYPKQIVRINGKNDPLNTITKEQFDTAVLNDNFIRNNNKLAKMEFQYLENESGANSGFRNKID